MKKLVILVVMVLLASCEKALMAPDALGANAGIVGTWVENSYQGDTLFLYRAGKLDNDKYGFTLEGDGTFIERKNAGMNGTASFSYNNYEGTWEAVSDSLLDITVAYWGGVLTYQIRIVSLDDAELAIRYLYSTDRMESTLVD